MYITREQAIEVLYTVGNSQILDRKLGKSLLEIANILQNEITYGLILWGAEDDVTDLFVMKRQGLIDDEWVQHCRELNEKYSLEKRIYNALLHADAGLKTDKLAKVIAEQIQREPGGRQCRLM